VAIFLHNFKSSMFLSSNFLSVLSKTMLSSTAKELGAACPPRRTINSKTSTDAPALRRKRKTADFADTRPGAPGGQFTPFVFIRAYPRHPRFPFDLQIFAAREELNG